MRNNLRKPSELTAFGQDQQQSFMVAQVTGQKLALQAIGLDGKVFDSVIIEQ
jgi:hypothetical protein